MKVLMITGDRKIFEPGSGTYQRAKLQEAQVEELKIVFWGRGALLPPSFPRGRYDIVTVQDPFWRGLVALLIARRIGARFNVQVHTSIAAQNFMRRALASFVLRRTHCIRAVSQAIKEEIEKKSIHTRVAILPVFVDISKFSSIEHKTHSSKNILWVGRFEEEKDPLYAIEVLQGVLKQMKDAKLLMVGEGSLRTIIEARAKGLPVSILGWQDPVPYLETADIVLSTSRYEGFGMSMIEALAAGVPVVAPPIGIAKEAGAIVAPREQLAEMVVKVLQGGIKGDLKLKFPSKGEWALEWKISLESCMTN